MRSAKQTVNNLKNACVTSQLTIKLSASQSVHGLMTSWLCCNLPRLLLWWFAHPSLKVLSGAASLILSTLQWTFLNFGALLNFLEQISWIQIFETGIIFEIIRTQLPASKLFCISFKSTTNYFYPTWFFCKQKLDYNVSINESFLFISDVHSSLSTCLLILSCHVIIVPGLWQLLKIVNSQFSYTLFWSYPQPLSWKICKIHSVIFFLSQVAVSVCLSIPVLAAS